MPPSPVYYRADTTSVLDAAHALAAERTLPIWGSVVARSQSRGRGQLRRNWVSPPGNLYAALRLPLSGVFAGGAASCAAAALLAEALGEWGAAVVIKWPNDLLLAAPEAAGGWGKVGGILLEERAGALIAGIGLNLASAPEFEQLREGGLPALCLCGRTRAGDLPPLLLWLRLVESFVFCYQMWRTFDTASLRDALERRLAWKGRRVLLDDGRERHTGRLLGPASGGGLRLQCGAEERIFESGALSLLP